MNVIIVLNYNDQETTKDFLDKIKYYDSLDKILVVDNKSSDNSYENLKYYESEKIRVISTESNEGYGSGNNYGVKYAEKFYSPTNIIISNPDIYISDDSIQNMINYINNNNDIAIVTGLILDKNERITNHFAWKLPSYSDFLINLSIILSKILHKFHKGNRYEISDIKRSDYLEVDVVQGCFFIIRASDFKKVGYFDEETFLYHEENILAYKLKKSKLKTYVLTNEKIIHQHGQSIKKTLKSSNSRKKYEFESAMIYLKKYLKISNQQEKIYTAFWNISKYENYIIERLKAIKDVFISSYSLRRKENIDK